MDISVIIVNYHTSAFIIDCVTSILEKTRGVAYEVIIIDNNSEPDFEDKINAALPEEKKGNFRFLALPENIGFGRANNEGLNMATGRNIFFLNPDTVLVNNAIKILSDFLDSHEKAGACGGNLYDAEKIPALSFKRLLPGVRWEINELFNLKPGKLIFGKNWIHNFTGQPIKVGYINGADLMVKREVLEKTGGFSQDFFLYYEETDLCNRIKRAGWDIYSVPEAEILHLESKSFSSTEAYESEFKTRMIETSRKSYYNRNKNKLSKVIANSIYYCMLMSRCLLIRDKRKKNYYRLRLKHFTSGKNP